MQQVTLHCIACDAECNLQYSPFFPALKIHNPFFRHWKYILILKKKKKVNTRRLIAKTSSHLYLEALLSLRHLLSNKAVIELALFPRVMFFPSGFLHCIMLLDRINVQALQLHH